MMLSRIQRSDGICATRYVRSLFIWPADRDAGTDAHGSIQHQVAPRERRALSHAIEPVSGASLTVRASNKAAAVIFHGQCNSGFACAKRHMDLSRMRVLANIVKRLLQNSKHYNSQRAVDGGLLQIYLPDDFDQRMRHLKFTTQPCDSRFDPKIIEHRRPQIHRNPAHFVDSASNARNSAFKLDQRLGA